MIQRRLGHSDLKISPIGLGCWQFSEGNSITGKYWTVLDEPTTNAIVQTSLDGNISWFDTAEAYGWGKSEAGLARALKAAKQKDGDVLIATKWFPILRRAKSITKTIDKRIKHLDGFSIDLHQIHSPIGSFSSHVRQLEAMVELVKAKKIKTIGVSNFSAQQMEKAFRFLEKKGLPLVSNQIKYSLLERKVEAQGIIQMAKDLGVTIIAYSPLAQGLLTGKFHENPNLIKERSGPRKRMKAFSKKGLEKSLPVINALREIAKRYDATPAQVALRWLLQYHNDTVVVIPGATKVSHAAQNVGAMQFELTTEELKTLDDISKAYL